MEAAVDVITPTLGRPDVHAQLYEGFASQTFPRKRLFVLDESKTASPFFSGLRDPRVIYRHEPSATLTGPSQGGIARARNRLLRMTSAPYICHADDDDAYGEAWVSTLLSRLIDTNADLVKSVRWRLLVEGAKEHGGGSIFEWDTRYFRGKVWAVKGGAPPEQIDVDETIDPQLSADMTDGWMCGFGWSYLYKRSLWERHPFPEDESTEDIPWVRACRAAGAKIELISDLPHLALHTVHSRSESPNFPQRRIAGAPTDMRELPRGKEIDVVPGARYSVLCVVKTKHTLKSLAKRASQWGVTVTSAEDNVNAKEYGVTAPSGGYRLVFLTATASKPGRMPWGVPKPLSIFDKTSCVRAWVSGAQRMAAGLPPLVVLQR